VQQPGDRIAPPPEELQHGRLDDAVPDVLSEAHAQLLAARFTYHRYLSSEGIWMLVVCQCAIMGSVARVTRAESKERTRQRLLAQAQRLFLERGYAATSLEQVAEAAEVTKGAIYGHFASKEDLLLSALEAAPPPDYTATLFDQSRPLRERLSDFSRAVSADEPGDTEELAVYLEFYAALLRAPEALRRFSRALEGRLQELAGADGDQPPAGVTPVQVWAIGQAMLAGLQIYKQLAPGLVTPEVFELTFGLLAGFYEER
jgi:AcrR family transcriptional regulator